MSRFNGTDLLAVWAIALGVAVIIWQAIAAWDGRDEMSQDHRLDELERVYREGEG